VTVQITKDLLKWILLVLRCRPLFVSRRSFIITVLISVYDTLHSKKYGVAVGKKSTLWCESRLAGKQLTNDYTWCTVRKIFLKKWPMVG